MTSAPILHSHAYPHIVDCIWSYMDPAALSVARRVSQAWRDRADTILLRQARHISLILREYDGEDEAPFRVGVVSRDAENNPESRALLCVLDYSGRDGLERLGTPLVPIMISGQARIVDLIGFPGFSAASLPELAGRQRAVRWHNTHPDSRCIDFSPPSDEAVFFLDLRPGEPIPVIRIAGTGPSLVVLSIDCYADPIASLPDAFPIFEPGQLDPLEERGPLRSLSTVFVILNDAAGGPPKRQASHEDSTGLLFNYARALADLEDEMVVIGLERFFDDERERNAYERRVQRCLTETWETEFEFREEYDERYPAEVVFISHEEFRSWRAVGPERYKMYNTR